MRFNDEEYEREARAEMRANSFLRNSSPEYYELHHDELMALPVLSPVLAPRVLTDHRPVYPQGTAVTHGFPAFGGTYASNKTHYPFIDQPSFRPQLADQPSEHPSYPLFSMYSDRTERPETPDPNYDSEEPQVPRVVLPPRDNRSTTQTPVHHSGSENHDFAPGAYQEAVEQYQNPSDSPDFSHLYLPIQARPKKYQHQHHHQHQHQHQLHSPYANPHQQQPMDHPDQQPIHQQQTRRPVPPPDRVRRQEILDEQAQDFCEEDDEIFYPH
ncbi:hypothetical protein F5Y04DRAFT_292106 [Hypomontagnella monticulosa]|nr:hypothetical protein F5Y04DRAFT_292106 [Hypomontagnella monticulosa]